MPERIVCQDSSRPSRRELGFHEAGHAVVAALLGLPIEWVTIDDATGCGQAEPDTNPFFRLEEPFESRRRVIVAMAGSAAQCLGIGREPQWMPVSEGDKRLAEDNAERAGLSPYDFSVVITILSRPDVWERVDRLAATLDQHGQLVAWNGLKEFLPEPNPKVYEIAGITPRAR
jgi:hypothetical protein